MGAGRAMRETSVASGLGRATLAGAHTAACWHLVGLRGGEHRLGANEREVDARQPATLLADWLGSVVALYGSSTGKGDDD